MRTLILAAVGLGLLLPALSLADIPIPGQPFRPRGPVERPPVAADISVVQLAAVKRAALKHANVKDSRTIKAKIIIPRGVLAGEKPIAIEKQGSTGSSTGTIIAGIALSLAAMSCVFLLRKNKAGRAVATGVLVIVGGIGIWSVARADLGPRSFRPQPAPESVILLEFVDEGDTITLILAK